MTSPPGSEFSQADLVARWMPSSSRAGVILDPCLDLGDSLRHLRPSRGSPPRGPDDSFSAHFAPLPASTNSSCLSVNVMSDRQSAGKLDIFVDPASKSHELSLMMKLEQLKQWQQQMQDQLKTHQLEELLRLQEEQKRLLGVTNGSQHCDADYTEMSRLSGADWEETTLQGASPHSEVPYSPTINHHRAPRPPPCAPQTVTKSPQEGRKGPLRREQDHEERDSQAGGTDILSSTEKDQEKSLDINLSERHKATLMAHNGKSITEDHHGDEENSLKDRPIKPGISGQKQTFEELLEEQLRLEEQRLRLAQEQQNTQSADVVSAPPKRVFLKRGEGLSRFTYNCKASILKREVKKDPRLKPPSRTISQSNSEPAGFQKITTSSCQRIPIQRKTAVVNKENQPKGPCSPQDFRAESKLVHAKVLGSHQRQNMEGADSTHTFSEGRRYQKHQLMCRLGHAEDQNGSRVGEPGQSGHTVRKPRTRDVHPVSVTREVGVLGGRGKADSDRVRDSGSGSFKVKPGRTGSDKVVGGGGEEKEREGLVPEDSFELSFQEKLRYWDCDGQKESVELGEFELLEQAAEELSFSSNSSFVTKILQMDQQQRQLQAAKGLHHRRLSSTPIKSPPKAQICSGSVSSSNVNIISKSHSSESQASRPKVKNDLQKSKTSDEDEDDEEENGEKVDENGGESKLVISDVSCSSSEFGGEEVVVKQPTFPSNLYFPAPSNLPYDKRSYQDQDSCRETVSDMTDGNNGESDHISTDPDDNTLTEDNDRQRGALVFDDDDTWNDFEDAHVGLANDSRAIRVVSKAQPNTNSPPGRLLTRKVAVTKGAESDKVMTVSLANQEAYSSPTSQLMTKLFPSLKPNVQTASPQALVPSEPRRAEEAPGQQVQSRQLRERLVELEIEIERFKKENAVLTRIRQENERNQENLRKEHLEFEQRKAEELTRFEEHKKEETKKLQKARKVFERHSSAARAIPDKKEREEIQFLKQQLSSMQEELRRKESRWSITHNRLRQQIDSLSAENSALREEVHTLEKLRLSAWKKGLTNGEMESEKREGPKIFDSGRVSSAKGVKFASPPDTRENSPPQSSCATATRGGPRKNSIGTTGMKSSLRKPAGPGSSTPTVSVRSTDEGPTHQTRSQDHIQNSSPVRVCLQSEPESNESKEPESDQDIISHPDGKMEKALPGGGCLIIYPNGTRREMSADRLTTKVSFFNGDTKQVMADQRVIYYYIDTQTTHTTYPDGMEVLQFPNNQTEKHFPDGRKEIIFPDQTVKNLYPDGKEESMHTDGTIILVNPDGSKEIQFNTGQKEIHTADYKRREYPDGTVKTVYTDGRQETRYPTGRVRVKDKDGNIVMDTKV
ncbi:centromere protein J [Lampris incognitus]|uniref:centromere protein J n=1 Tax=Lampris incognitus TaxID=2546036 RepID=UPI0024B6128D|nr:centromere protein J [Lampris incognitus]